MTPKSNIFDRMTVFIYDLEDAIKNVLEDENNKYKFYTIQSEIDDHLRDIGLKRCSCCEKIKEEKRFSKRDPQRCLDYCINGGDCDNC